LQHNISSFIKRKSPGLGCPNVSGILGFEAMLHSYFPLEITWLHPGENKMESEVDKQARCRGEGVAPVGGGRGLKRP
jgi:hypothetical protein